MYVHKLTVFTERIMCLSAGTRYVVPGSIFIGNKRHTILGIMTVEVVNMPWYPVSVGNGLA